MPTPPPSSQRTGRRPRGGDRARRRRSARADRAAVVLALILGLAALRAASTVLVPVVIGLALAALLWPLQQRLRRSVPRLVAFLVSLLVVLAGFAVGVGLVWLSFDALSEQAPRFAERIEQVREALRSGLASRDIPAPGVLEESGSAGASTAGASASTGTTTQGTGNGGTGNGGTGDTARGWAETVLRAFLSGSALLGLAVAFFALGLWEVDEVRQKLRRQLGRGGEKAFAIAARVAHEFRRFAVVKTLTSAITGLATGVATWLLGVDHPWVWGLAAFALEYVPTIGSFLAVFPPALYALVQFDGFTRPLIVLVTVGALQLVLGNYVDPKIEGRYLSISPFVVLLAVVFWGWVWGIPGALLGVPMTLTLVVIAREFPSSRWLAVLIAGEEDEEEG